MNWKLKLPGNDFAVYEFVSDNGETFSCKHNISSGSLRLKYRDYHSVFIVDKDNFANRKVVLTNVYGSEVGTVIKNLWRENTGHIILNDPGHKINYSIDTRSSIIEVTEYDAIDTCDLKGIPHPGRHEHYVPVLIALAWINEILSSKKIKEAVA